MRPVLEKIAIFTLSGLLLLASWLKWLPLDLTEAAGFATGAICVLLITQGSLWNWPIGLMNNLFFAILFWRTRLYADFALQFIYLGFGIYGWWKWLHGGENGSRLKISRATRKEWIAVTLILPAGTWGLHEILIQTNGSSPFWDSLTTVLSLIAQYFLCRKRRENWIFWIAADMIYVPLYLSKNLPLTALLYAGFIALCIIGWRRWKKESTT